MARCPYQRPEAAKFLPKTVLTTTCRSLELPLLEADQSASRATMTVALRTHDGDDHAVATSRPIVWHDVTIAHFVIGGRTFLPIRCQCTQQNWQLVRGGRRRQLPRVHSVPDPSGWHDNLVVLLSAGGLEVTTLGPLNGRPDWLRSSWAARR